jgi:hypothetical protein
MNHSVSSTQLLDKAIASFIYFKSSEGLRDRSIDSYRHILNQCVEDWGPVNVTKLTSYQVSLGYSNPWLVSSFACGRFATHRIVALTDSTNLPILPCSG